jgi:Domain of unknown function (DUF222)/HNH endonuclease
VPSSAGEALEMVLAGLRWLAGADLASVPAAVQADGLRQFEDAESLLTVARASVLSAFDRQRGFEDDGQGTARTWLRWQTKVSNGAAASSVGWMRRLRAHQPVAAALASARISASWARYICDWTDPLPEAARGQADTILLRAAAGGADLKDLAAIAAELRAALARPGDDNGGPGGPGGTGGTGGTGGNGPGRDGKLWFATTTDGAGRVEGDLTPGCAAALQAVLESLGKKAGPEDTRTIPERQHDALHEACRRLVAAGGLPDRAGQPTQIQLHISLDELLRRLHGATGTGGPGGNAASPVPGWPLAAPGEACDAQVVPIVTGVIDHALLARLTEAVTGLGPGADLAPDGTPRVKLNTDSLRDLIIANAAALFSGPRGLASWLRRRELDGIAGSVSLPLDTGTSTETIPPHLRRAVILRDRHCAAPGCDQPPAACQVHHVVPRSKGGRTKLTNLLLLCSFHHLILVHQWDWTITLNPDGTTTMRDPTGTKIFHSHSPPAVAV